ncbi:L-threonylcarbamoyladenylate synthase [Candidatus Woesearchaeota archaeon]|nr:L-threonylcarbamoyladenylate synthase [Candidatus Woesearchaeota archaeon]
MEIFTKKELQFRQKEILQRIKDGAIFICATDTIYGLSCNALLEHSVAKIRQLKHRSDSPFSVWAPSLAWIEKNCEIKNNTASDWLKKLPGPYTLILPLKKNKGLSGCIAKNVCFGNTLGVRLPNHWVSKIVEELSIPLITTSANKSGKPFMTSLETLDPDIAVGVEFLIYEGPKEARPSQIVDLTTPAGTVKSR